MDFLTVKGITIPEGNAISLHINGVKVWEKEQEQEETLAAGLYDANDNLVASWDTLVNTYGMDCTIDYNFLASSTTTSPSYVLTNNNTLVNGVNLIIGDGVTKIGDFAFFYCSSLTNIEIPDSVTSIGACAFEGCKSLISITIGNSVTSIGDYAFKFCSSLKRVSFSTHTAVPTIQSGVFSDTHSDLQIKVPANLIDSWKNATNWSNYADKIVTEFTNEV